VLLELEEAKYGEISAKSLGLRAKGFD